MLYFQITAGTRLAPTALKAIAYDSAEAKAADRNTLLSRNDFRSFADAEKVAALLGEGYIPTDAGSHVSPRYDVQALPKVGDDVSYGFNGDYYPAGKITSISKGPLFRKVVATNAAGRVHTFWRRRKSGSWVMDQTWSLVGGIHNERNPSF